MTKSAKHCIECGEEIRLVVCDIETHSRRRHSLGGESYTLRVKAACDCASEKAQATDFTSVRFPGNPPEGWE